MTVTKRVMRNTRVDGVTKFTVNITRFKSATSSSVQKFHDVVGAESKINGLTSSWFHFALRSRIVVVNPAAKGMNMSNTGKKVTDGFSRGTDIAGKDRKNILDVNRV